MPDREPYESVDGRIVIEDPHVAEFGTDEPNPAAWGERPSAGQAQLAVAVAALQRLALYEPMTVTDADGEPRNRSAELNARLAYAAGTLETVARLADERPDTVLLSDEWPATKRKMLGDLLGSHVTVTSPSGSQWTGRMIALADDPSLVLDCACGLRVNLPQSFEVTAAPGPAEAPEPPPIPPLPPGDYGRMELPGFRSHTGWWTPGVLAGQSVMVCSDRDGNAVAEYIPGPASRFVRLPVPSVTAPEAGRRALGWSGDDEERYPDLHVPACQDDNCEGECQDGEPF